MDYTRQTKYRKNWDKKVKEIPLQAWAGPEVSRRLRLPDFKNDTLRK